MLQSKDSELENAFYYGEYQYTSINTTIAGLEVSYISKNTALFTAVEFVGPGYSKGTVDNGYTTYVSKDGRYFAQDMDIKNTEV